MFEFGIASPIAGIGTLFILYMIITGVGTWGLNNQVDWAWDITNFVFWIGIGHAGTLISAILCLLKQKWRTAVNRSAEAMTIFAVICAGIFPGIHVGRIWKSYFILPYPNQRALWVNFKSPLLWDVFAISTYASISIVFFYVGLIPDIAIARDRATGIKKALYTVLALGWQGTGPQWKAHSRTVLHLSGLATPLVLSVHSVVSWDFAMSTVPGWHTTIFAPYFVAGAIFSGLSMVMTVLIPIRTVFGLEDYITKHVIQSVCRVIIFTSIIVGYAYATEFFIAWYSGSPYERAIFYFRPFGEMASWSLIGDQKISFPLIAFWLMVFCNVIAPIPLWRWKVRNNPLAVWIICALINVGMWFERYVIIITSLSREYISGSWGLYVISPVELSVLAGSFCWFSMWFLLFLKVFPVIAITEVKELAIHAKEHAAGGGH